MRLFSGGIWAWPIVLALLSASGLLSALVSDGAGDAWAWFALSAPIGALAWFGLGGKARNEVGGD